MKPILIRHKRKDYPFRKLTEFRWACDIDQRTILVCSAPSQDDKTRPWRVIFLNDDRKDMGPTSRFSTVKNAGRAALEYLGI